MRLISDLDLFKSGLKTHLFRILIPSSMTTLLSYLIPFRCILFILYLLSAVKHFGRPKDCCKGLYKLSTFTFKQRKTGEFYTLWGLQTLINAPKNKISLL